MPAETPASRHLRLWPGVAAGLLVVFLRYLLPLAVPDAVIVGMIGAAAGLLVILIWWLFFSRAPWGERLGTVALMFAAILATRPFLHPSVTGGMMGMMFYVYAVPTVILALPVWAVASRRLSGAPRLTAMIGLFLIAAAGWTVVRTAGVRGAGSEFHWRWTPTAEERLLVQSANERLEVPAPPPSTLPAAASAELPSAAAPAVGSGEASAAVPSSEAKPQAATASEAAPPPAAPKKIAEWPGFRGPNRDGIVRGVQIDTDWSTRPPSELWRQPIGPGWSSFAVSGDLLYTQEQRGDDEIVACYRVSTGAPVWKHRDAVRFWESNGGAGPRGTPTVAGGRVYALGATGILNALDAATGAVLWSRDAAKDTGAQLPGWGFAGSPLVADAAVIVSAAGALAAYDVATGRPRWFGPLRDTGYSSPQLITIDGVPQILLLHGSGATSVALSDGTVLWEHVWPGAAIVQPAVVASGDLIISTATAAGGVGTRRIEVSHQSGKWTLNERWTSTGLKPYFNDYVIHKNHAYGFDGSILSCIDLADGKRLWKGGRYGSGQLVLLADQDLLLVISEEGELALVKAVPDAFAEIARFTALNSKTWNHPVLVRDLLLVRNGEEMAAFRLTGLAR